MKHILYCTINKVNFKIYIGVHKTDTPWIFDGYLGCGAWNDAPSSYNQGKFPLHAAILKYGVKSFHRTTLRVFDTEEEALNAEAEIVTPEFISQSHNYNATVGGGKPPLLNKPIYQFDIRGNLIKKWDIQSDVNRHYGTNVNLCEVVSKKRSFAGFLWNTEDHIDNIEEYDLEPRYSFISQYNLDGELLAQFKSSAEAAQKLDIPRSEIVNAVTSKRPRSGYYFLKSAVDIAELLKSRKEKRSPNKQPVYRYLETGEFDAEFSTTMEAVRATPKAHSSSIKNAVVDGLKCGGYRWSYIKSDNYFNIENPKECKKYTKIAQYSLDGELIKIWDLKECRKVYRYCIRNCTGSLKSTAGFVFKYYEE